VETGGADSCCASACTSDDSDAAPGLRPSWPLAAHTTAATTTTAVTAQPRTMVTTDPTCVKLKKKSTSQLQ